LENLSKKAVTLCPDLPLNFLAIDDLEGGIQRTILCEDNQVFNLPPRRRNDKTIESKKRYRCTNILGQFVRYFSDTSQIYSEGD